MILSPWTPRGPCTKLGGLEGEGVTVFTRFRRSRSVIGVDLGWQDPSMQSEVNLQQRRDPADADTHISLQAMAQATHYQPEQPPK